MTPGFEPKTYNGALAHMIEEAGELLAAAGKTLRFGPDGTNPFLPEEVQETNEAWLLRELKDLRAAMDRFEQMAGFKQELKIDEPEQTCEYDAILRKVSIIEWRGELLAEGEVYCDRKGRFNDEDVITTSKIIFRGGDFIKTRNSVYKIEGPVCELPPKLSEHGGGHA